MNTVGIVAVHEYIRTCATALELAELTRLIGEREAALNPNGVPHRRQLEDILPGNWGGGDPISTPVNKVF